jgi:hypothetical protein
MPDMHLDFSHSMAKTLDTLGATLYVPDESFSSHIKYGLKFIGGGYITENAYYDFPALRKKALEFTALDNVKVTSYEELLSEDIDLYICPCSIHDIDMHNLFDTHKAINPKLKMCHWSGNNSDIHKYKFESMQNIFTGDIMNYEVALSAGKHTIYFFPYIDYDKYEYSGHSSSIFIRNYIIKHAEYWKEGWEISNVLKNNMSAAGMDEYVRFDLEPDWRTPPFDDIPQLMKDSMATVHIKEKEGFGYSICHSLASGRPLIMYNKYKDNKTYNNWCIHDETTIFFDIYEDLFIKLSRYIFDESYRNMMQESAARTIREAINNQEQTENFKKFVEDLR